MSVTQIDQPKNWFDDWEEWRLSREAGATAPYGLASVTGTHWLTEEPSDVDGLPGRWSARDGVVHGTGFEGADVALSPADAPFQLGSLQVKALVRAGQFAVRVFDPDAATRLSTIGIDAFDPDPAWVLTGRFVAAAAASTVAIRHVDGAETDFEVVGTVHVTVAGHEAELVAFAAAGGGLQITFADRTNGETSQQFRFLTLPAPQADGQVTVDLNRAYLPPCAFTEHYLCPIPPAANRLPVPVPAGETFARRRVVPDQG